MITALPPSPALTSAHKIKDSTCAGRSAWRSGNLVMAPAPMMITSTCVETSAQSLPAPAATQSVVLTSAVPVSSHSYSMMHYISHVWMMVMRKDCSAAQRWTVLVNLLRTSMAFALMTALPPSPVLTSAHRIKDSTCVESTA